MDAHQLTDAVARQDCARQPQPSIPIHDLAWTTLSYARHHEDSRPPRRYPAHPHAHSLIPYHVTVISSLDSCMYEYDTKDNATIHITYSLLIQSERSAPIPLSEPR